VRHRTRANPRLDDEGRKSTPTENLDDWWTPADLQELPVRTDCPRRRVQLFTAVPGEEFRQAQGHGAHPGREPPPQRRPLLAFMAYLSAPSRTHRPRRSAGRLHRPAALLHRRFSQNWCQKRRARVRPLAGPAGPPLPRPLSASTIIVTSPASLPPSAAKPKRPPMAPPNPCRHLVKRGGGGPPGAPLGLFFFPPPKKKKNPPWGCFPKFSLESLPFRPNFP